jgi:hypothetical protein
VKPSPIPNFLSRLHAEPLNLADPRTVGLLR